MIPRRSSLCLPILPSRSGANFHASCWSTSPRVVEGDRIAVLSAPVAIFACLLVAEPGLKSCAEALSQGGQAIRTKTRFRDTKVSELSQVRRLCQGERHLVIQIALL